MNYYAVIDTNVLVSALLKSASIPGIVARESLEGQIIPLLNDEIIAEYRAVLSRPSQKAQHGKPVLGLSHASEQTRRGRRPLRPASSGAV